MKPQATVVITTKDRKEDLRKALRSAFNQTVQCEVLVTDDASTDGTADVVAKEFPEARLLRSDECIGLIAQRNRSSREASTNFIFSIDDDAEFGSPEIVEQTLADFNDARIGAIAIPQIDTTPQRVVNDRAPQDGEASCVASFVGTAYAVRRNVFLNLGGFDASLIHQGEESDFCLRMLAAGYVVRLGTSDMILHHESPRRSFARMDYYGRRNDVLFACRHVPLHYLPLHLAGTTFNGLRWACRSGRPFHMLRGLVAGYVEGATLFADRQPVSAEIYQLFRRLKKSGPLKLSEMEHHLLKTSCTA